MNSQASPGLLGLLGDHVVVERVAHRAPGQRPVARLGDGHDAEVLAQLLLEVGNHGRVHQHHRALARREVRVGFEVLARGGVLVEAALLAQVDQLLQRLDELGIGVGQLAVVDLRHVAVVEVRAVHQRDPVVGRVAVAIAEGDRGDAGLLERGARAEQVVPGLDRSLDPRLLEHRLVVEEAVGAEVLRHGDDLALAAVAVEVLAGQVHARQRVEEAGRLVEVGVELEQLVDVGRGVAARVEEHHVRRLLGLEGGLQLGRDLLVVGREKGDLHVRALVVGLEAVDLRVEPFAVRRAGRGAREVAAHPELERARLGLGDRAARVALAQSSIPRRRLRRHPRTARER